MPPGPAGLQPLGSTWTLGPQLFPYSVVGGAILSHNCLSPINLFLPAAAAAFSRAQALLFMFGGIKSGDDDCNVNSSRTSPTLEGIYPQSSISPSLASNSAIPARSRERSQFRDAAAAVVPIMDDGKERRKERMKSSLSSSRRKKEEEGKSLRVSAFHARHSAEAAFQLFCCNYCHVDLETHLIRWMMPQGAGKETVTKTDIFH